MTSNLLSPLRITPDMKGEKNTGIAFKEEIKETHKHCDKKEKDNTQIQAMFQSKVQDESWLWHFVFGHHNFGGMKLLHTKNMVKIFPSIDKLERVWEGCTFGKKHRETFLVGKSYKSLTPLEIVHSDICSPM